MALPLSNDYSPPPQRKERSVGSHERVKEHEYKTRYMKGRLKFRCFDSHVFTSDLEKKGPSQNEQSCINKKQTISEFKANVELMCKDTCIFHDISDFLMPKNQQVTRNKESLSWAKNMTKNEHSSPLR